MGGLAQKALLLLECPLNTTTWKLTSQVSGARRCIVQVGVGDVIGELQVSERCSALPGKCECNVHAMM